MRLLAKDPHLSQRQLASALGISLGRTNFCLRALIDKGLVKVDNFRRNPNKRGYAYLLTAKGIEQKLRITVRFLRRKEAEHARLLDEIAQLRGELADQQDPTPADA